MFTRLNPKAQAGIKPRPMGSRPDSKPMNRPCHTKRLKKHISKCSLASGDLNPRPFARVASGLTTGITWAAQRLKEFNYVLPHWILRLGQDFQKFIIRQEEESGKVESFLLQVIIESLMSNKWWMHSRATYYRLLPHIWKKAHEVISSVTKWSPQKPDIF